MACISRQSIALAALPTIANAPTPASVERTRGLLPPTAVVERVGFVIWAPPAQTFVDSVHCHVDSP